MEISSSRDVSEMSRRLIEEARNGFSDEIDRRVGRHLTPAQEIGGRVVDITNNKYDRRIVLPNPSRSEVLCLTWEEIHAMVPNHPGLVTDFAVERVSIAVGVARGSYVAFRAKDTNLYLTAVPYGKGPRCLYERLLRPLGTTLLPEIVDAIVDYLVAPASLSEWLEGPGFCYSPIAAEPGPPTTLQLFKLRDRDHRGRRLLADYDEVGIQTFHGTYLRSGPGVCNVASQSPLCEDDEKWELLSDDEASDSDSDNDDW